MSNVVSLSGQQSMKAGAAQPEVVSMLEEALASAKEGRIQHCVMVTIDPDGIPADAYAPGGLGPEIVTMIGGLELCKTMLTLAMCQADGKEVAS